MISLSLLTAFIAGVGSFFAPCVVPLLPAYVSYTVGLSVKKSKALLIYSALMYLVGFSLVFTLLGVAAGGLGSLLREYTRAIQFLGGVVMIFFGLEFIGLVRTTFMSFQKGPKLPYWINKVELLRSFFIGVVFALTWSPCMGPILGSILSLAATTGTAMQGALLLLTYSLGISIPFIIVAITLTSAPKYLHLHRRFFLTISKISGVILIIFGVLLVTDTYKYLNYVIGQF